MTLLELLNIANSAYPDNYLAEYYDESTGERRAGQGDSLAAFIVNELVETYSPDASSQDQLSEAVHVMEVASDNLLEVVRVLARHPVRELGEPDVPATSL